MRLQSVVFFFLPVLFCGPLAGLRGEVPYKVEYLGIEEGPVLKTVKSVSQLRALQKTPPDSIRALRYRAESDIPDIIKVLHSQGYYEASAEIDIQERKLGATVFVTIDTGPVYRLSSFRILWACEKEHPELPYPDLDPTRLGIRIGSKIRAARVINAELEALRLLAAGGYPLASVTDRSVVADGDTKSVDVTITIDPGPPCRFGPVSITGNQKVKSLFFEQREEWKEGDPYSSEKTEETEKILMDSGLFSAVTVTHDKQVTEGDFLPIRIDVTESKHRSVYAGVSYQTYYGPGLTFGWEHRNVAGLGRKFSLEGDITKRSHVGSATYLFPNFLKRGQDYVWKAQAGHLEILPFSERSYHITNRLEKKLSKSLRVAFGAEGERLFVNASVQNGNYWIFEVPIFLGYNAADGLLNPTKGYNIEYRAVPAFAFSPGRNFYLTQKLSIGTYIPLDPGHFVTIAQKFSGGTILSGREEEIPVPRRFFGGSEEDLRGYAYYSVSPLGKENQPTGGRTALYYTLETRFRLTKSIGIVPFFDLGNVSENQLFIPSGKWLKSVGCGLRYFSFIGPFRLDAGFPLNPRKGIDKKCRILVSVGQSF